MARKRDEKGRFAAADDGTQGAPADDGKRKAAAGAGKRRAGGRKRKKDRYAIFFRELSILCNVSSALRKAGLTSQSGNVYERLGTDPAFLARWNAAIARSYALLELEMLERQRFGDNRPAPKTEVEKRLRAVPTGQALQLLKLHQSRAARIAAAAPPPPPPARRRPDRRRAREIRLEVERMLSEFNRRMGGEG